MSTSSSSSVNTSRSSTVPSSSFMRENEVLCSYCGKPAALVSGKEIYPHRDDLIHKKFWRCLSCKAHVGCHPPTAHTQGRSDIPLGRLANAELRAAKQAAHEAFDRVWKDRLTSRKSAYGLLAARLGIRNSACHIGMFDVAMCRRTVEEGKKLYAELTGEHYGRT